MILLAGFLEVVFKALVLVGLALAVGGVAFTGAVLAPERAALPATSFRRAATLVAIGGGGILVFQGLVLVIEPWALADDLGRWPLRDFLATGFARAGIVHALLGGALAAAALRVRARPRATAGWAALAALAVALLASGAWLVHAVSRLEGAVPLMIGTVLHQLGAALWVGGLVHLLAQRRLSRLAPELADRWPALLARFSNLAAGSVAVIAGTGLLLSWRYVASLRGLVGTAYGAMVLTKVGLMAVALGLGLLNLVSVRRWRRSRDRGDADRRAPWLVEAEAGIVVVILLAAAALTSQPPAVDVGAEQATPREVAETFAPKLPRLVPPPHREMVSQATSSFDPYGVPGTLDRMQSTFNHNVSGVLVLLVALGAVLDRTGRFRAARHWPLGFLLLAAFILLLAEPNGWPFGTEGFFETLVAPSVLQHRLATLLVVGLALFEWRVRVGALAATRWRFAFPLLCTIGGALLLTHSHSVSALKWAYLIELSHNAIGLLAVLMGVGRWLELRLRPPEDRIPGLVWPACMMLVGLVLLFYREA